MWPMTHPSQEVSGTWSVCSFLLLRPPLAHPHLSFSFPLCLITGFLRNKTLARTSPLWSSEPRWPSWGRAHPGAQLQV